MTQAPQTFSASHLRRQRDAHNRSDGYGRHRHLYLHDTIRHLAHSLRHGDSADLAWLDYGCGKGTFMAEIRPLGLFAQIVGYDPAVETFRARPQGRFDLVTCLDVIDVAESQYVPNIFADVAAAAAGLALFDVLTRPRPDSPLRPHPPFHWTHLVGQHLKLLDSRVEFAGMQSFERVLILAAPRDTTLTLRLARS